MKACRLVPTNEQLEHLRRAARRKAERGFLWAVIGIGLFFATLMFLPSLFL